MVALGYWREWPLRAATERRGIPSLSLPDRKSVREKTTGLITCRGGVLRPSPRDFTPGIHER